MEPLHLRITIRRPGPAVRPLAFATGPQPYSVRLESDGRTRDSEIVLTWNDGVDKLLRDLAFPSEARVERAGAWVGGFLSQVGLPLATGSVRAAAEAQRPVHLSIVSDAPEILALPWSLLPAGRTRLSALPGVRIRRSWPGVLPPLDDSESARSEGRIGLAWSGAGGRVSEAAHIEAMQQASAVSGGTFHPFTDVLRDASLEGLGRWLRQAREHGKPIRALALVCRTAPLPDGRMGLVLDTAPGLTGPVAVDPEALARALAPHSDMVRFVALCLIADDPPPPESWRSLAAALALHQAGVPAVLGTRMPLSRQGSARALGGLTAGLLAGVDGAEGAVEAARAALGAPEDARDQDALCLLADDDHSTMRPLLRRPWPGLAPLGPEHARTFTGRSETLDTLHEQMETLSESGAPRFFVLAGASGTGKTSLIQAGLLPRLSAQGAWDLETLHPTGDVEARLGAAIGTPVPAGMERLVVVDPFEAVFDLPRATQQRLVQALWRAASVPRSRTTVLLCIRIEALGRCGELVIDDTGTRLDAVALAEAHQLVVRDPGPRALREMLEGPAAAGGLVLEPDLAHRIAGAVSGLRPALPHLAAVTARLWSSRVGRSLTSASWQAIGDPAHAIATLADHVLEGLPPARRPEALRVLRTLAVAGGSAGPPHARWEPRARLRPRGDHDDARHHDAVVAHLVEGGLLRDEDGPEGQGLTLAHDQLAAAWPRLYAPSDVPPVAAPAAGAVVASATAVPAAQRPSRSLPAWPFVVVSVLALVVAVGVLLWGHEAREARRDADAALGAASDIREDPTRTAALLRAAASARDLPTWTRLANTTLQETLSHAVLRGLDGPVDALWFSPDGTRLLTLAGGVPTIWSLDDDTTPLARAEGVASLGIIDAAFRPDGAAVLLVTRTGTVLEWDPSDRTPRRLWSPAETAGVAAAVSISRTGSHVLVATESGWTIIDQGGATVGAGVLPGEEGLPPGAPTAAAIDEDGTRWAIASRDGRLHLWNSELPDPARIRHPGVTDIAINREGSHLLSVGDGRLRLTDLTHMRGVTRTPTPVQVHTAIFSPIGRHVLVDYTHRDAGTHHTRTLSVDLRTEQFETDSLRVAATALLLDETRDRLVRGREDGRVEELDRRDGRVLRVLRGHRGRVTTLRTSPDGRWLATAAADQTVRVWSNRDPQPARFLPLPRTLVGAVQLALSEDGRYRLAFLEPRGWVRVPLDDPSRPPETAQAPDIEGPVQGFTGTRDGLIQAPDGTETRAFNLAVIATCASNDGRWVGAISQVGEVVRWDREANRIERLGEVEPPPRRCRLSQDGSTLMTRGRVEVQVWRSATLAEPVLRTRAAPERDGPTVHLSLDGGTLTTLDENGGVRRWTIDPAGLQSQLWARTPTCGGSPDDTDVDRFCACEACFGRSPAVCGAAANLDGFTGSDTCPGG